MGDILNKLIFLYGEEKGEQVFEEIKEIVAVAKTNIHVPQREYFSEKDAVLITYADSFQENGKKPLQTLHKFLNSSHFANHPSPKATEGQEATRDKQLSILNSVHILPFFPYSSDRGFSIIDFNKVKEEFGDWEDIETISKEKKLMCDLVLNHVSTQSNWFQKFLQGDPAYENFFISFKEADLTPELKSDLQKVFRPRSTPLLTKFETQDGPRYVWTTFSVGTTTDQVDLNYQNHQVLLEIIKVILQLIQKGAQLLRLDAVTYVWKKTGTSSVHLAEGHMIIQIVRDLLNEIAPSALLITETNVPHSENISYFGNGHNEAQMVYNFALPPLVLYSFQKGRSESLTNWAKSLTPPSQETTFFNFLASHDGIGMLGAKGVIDDEDIETMCNEISENGGKVSYRSLPNGQKSAYEVCGTWWSVINKETDTFETNCNRFITSYAICFALAGIPGIYYLSLFGKENDTAGFEKTNHTRDINRENLDLAALEEELTKNDSKGHKVFESFKELLKRRTNHPAFHPNAPQTVLSLDERVFALLREASEGNMLTLHNLSGEEVTVTYEDNNYFLAPYSYIWKSL